MADALRSVGGSLNHSQDAAIHSAAQSTLTLWQGPPGTGKTRTIVCYVSALRHVTAQAGVRILVCAGSNVAVDNLVEGLLALGVGVVRVGQPAKVQAALRAATLDAQVVRHRDGARCPLYTAGLRRCCKRRAVSPVACLSSVGANAATPLSGAAAARLRAAAANMRGAEQANAFQEAQELEASAVRAVLGGAAVVASTCVGLGEQRLEGRRFDVCVVDEASQVTEPDSLVAVTKARARPVLPACGG